MEKIKELKNHDKMVKVSPLENRPKTIEQCKESTEYIISKEKIFQLNSPLASDNTIYSLGKHQINCVEFAPSVFSYLRELDGVSEKEVIDSFLPSNNKQGIQESEARGGNFFISTDNKQFLLKTIPYQDAELIRLVLLWHLAEHFTENKNSLIGRIYGLYKIEKKSSCFSSEDIYFILMKNVYGAFDEIVQCKYDLKGSSLDRTVNIHSMDTLNKKVMKDNNFREIERALLLSKTNSQKLTTNCEKDVVLLANLGVMDYSLLVVKLTLNSSEMVALFGEDHFVKTQQEISELLNKNIDNKEENNEKMLVKFEEIRFDLEKIENLRKYLFPSLISHQAYIIAIIDFFQLYNLGKAIEQKFKGMIADIMAISSSPPDDYVVRFLENLNEICNCKKLFENDENNKVFNGFVVVD